MDAGQRRGQGAGRPSTSSNAPISRSCTTRWSSGGLRAGGPTASAIAAFRHRRRCCRAGARGSRKGCATPSRATPSASASTPAWAGTRCWACAGRRRTWTRWRSRWWKRLGPGAPLVLPLARQAGAILDRRLAERERFCRTHAVVGVSLRGRSLGPASSPAAPERADRRGGRSTVLVRRAAQVLRRRGRR